MKLHPQKLKRRSLLPAYVLAVLILVGVAFYFMRVITRRDPLAATDFSVFWASARLLRHGQSPYDPNDWAAIYRQMPNVPRQDNAFLYPLPTAIVFLPLSFVPESLARDLWLVFSQLMIIGAAVISMFTEEWRHDRLRLLPIVGLSLIVFVPAMYAVMNGQINSVLVAIVALTILFWSRKKWVAGGLVLGLLILKPTGAGTFAFAVIIWLILLKKWGGLVGVALTLASAFTVAWVVDPRWLGDWLNIALAKPAQMWPGVPTLWGLFVSLFGPEMPWLLLAAILSGMLLLFGVRVASRKEPDAQLTWLSGIVLPLSLTSTPYLLYYEMVMLIPSTPHLCRVILVAGDGLLSQAVSTRTASFGNVSCLPTLNDLAGLINTLASQVSEAYVAGLEPKAETYFFSPGDDSCLFIKQDIQGQILSRFQVELGRIPPGADRRTNHTWYIASPRFLSKERQRISWASRISIEAKASKPPRQGLIIYGSSPDLPSGQPRISGSSILPESSTSEVSDILPITPRITPDVTGWFQSPYDMFGSSGSFKPTESARVVSTGNSVFEVTWSISIDASKRFSHPKVEAIEHIETTWE